MIFCFPPPTVLRLCVYLCVFLNFAPQHKSEHLRRRAERVRQRGGRHGDGGVKHHQEQKAGPPEARRGQRVMFGGVSNSISLRYVQDGVAL